MSKVVFLITCFLVLALLPLVVQAKGQQNYIDLLNASDTISSFNPISAPGAQLYNDMMLEYTIAAINADPNLLPNHWLYVKRFNTKGKVGSRAYSSLVMLDILQNPEHQDIVGFIDNTPSERISETFHQSEIVELCALNRFYVAHWVHY
ncbi:hypothetical protein BCR33DRAFT_733202 [Rhizoclosmatium globosum]|uniref:Uncharacterized protein n=1 Tax=Rhizoclosmatium globosum TaxID=329046 RepID=A0A1Y2CZP9_9FUNG|nr:hypothetical protein BCR33DRAFT_733202 [Rhizoclosmatium globosum]|eukprot:ORY52503.1 hypothetical protein BCR33DRAFT_733202 [Rhizoclosmatium globosum]